MNITGDESWLDTPAGRAWKPLFDRLPDGFRWAPKQVAIALVEAERVIAASTGRVGPRQSGSVLGALVGGESPRLRFLPHEVTWAQAVVLWPRTYLLDDDDPAHRRIERQAIRLWLRKKSGESLTYAERQSIKARSHYGARKRGFVLIATGLMRDRVAVPTDDIDETDSAEPMLAPIEREPTLAAWHDEEAEPVRLSLDYDPVESDELFEAIAFDVLQDIAGGKGMGPSLVTRVNETIESEFASAPEGHRRDVAMSKRRTALMDEVGARVRRVQREARESAEGETA
jgi:hypothetical protein